MTEHVTHELLQLLADRELTGDAAQSVVRHIRECASCSATFGTMVQFDRFARTMPVPVLRREFTRDLISRLGIQPHTPMLFRIFEHAASVVAVLLVVMMGATVWALIALSGGEYGVKQEFPGQRVVNVAGKWLESGYLQFGDWLSRIVPEVFGGQAARIAVMLLLMVPLVALADWLAGRKGTSGSRDRLRQPFRSRRYSLLCSRKILHIFFAHHFRRMEGIPGKIQPISRLQRPLALVRDDLHPSRDDNDKILERMLMSSVLRPRTIRIELILKSLRPKPRLKFLKCGLLGFVPAYNIHHCCAPRFRSDVCRHSS